MPAKDDASVSNITTAKNKANARTNFLLFLNLITSLTYGSILCFELQED